MSSNMVELQLVVYQSKGGGKKQTSIPAVPACHKYFFIIVVHEVIPVLSDGSFSATSVGVYIKL